MGQAQIRASEEIVTTTASREITTGTAVEAIAQIRFFRTFCFQGFPAVLRVPGDSQPRPPDLQDAFFFLLLNFKDSIRITRHGPHVVTCCHDRSVLFNHSDNSNHSGIVIIW